MNVHRLCVFDFDGTLFRSPERPSWWTDEAWWSNPASIHPPCVPETPSQEWWIDTTLTSARQVLQDPQTYTVLLTGRKEALRDRVEALLSQQNLSFHEVLLTVGDDSKAYKLQQVKRLIAKLPTVTKTEFWEDRPELLIPMKTFLDSKQIEFQVHPVTVSMMPAMCNVQKIAQSVRHRYEKNLRLK